MSIMIDQRTRVVVQGITGRFGSYHSQRMREYGTQVVAGVTPGKGGEEVGGIPVFDSLGEAKEATGAEVVAVLVPGPFVKDAAFEAIDAGIDLIVCLVEGVPVQDTMMIARRLRESHTRMIGPNSPGLVSPGRSLVGFMPGHVYLPGPVGIVSRSGTFSYQVAQALTQRGVGQSTCLGIGGDPISGMSFGEVLDLFEDDPGTEVIVLIGEIGRTAEEEAAEHIRAHIRKPVFSMILGATAPPGKQMGHAGAIITAGKGTYASKAEALHSAGVPVARTASELAGMVAEWCAAGRRA
jgi:succinyl-CoA synthetase alpha subunit